MTFKTISTNKTTIQYNKFYYNGVPPNTATAQTKIPATLFSGFITVDGVLEE